MPQLCIRLFLNLKLLITISSSRFFFTLREAISISDQFVAIDVPNQDITRRRLVSSLYSPAVLFLVKTTIIYIYEVAESTLLMVCCLYSCTKCNTLYEPHSDQKAWLINQLMHECIACVSEYIFKRKTLKIKKNLLPLVVTVHHGVPLKFQAKTYHLDCKEEQREKQHITMKLYSKSQIINSK